MIRASKGSIVAQENKEKRYCRKWIIKCSCGGKQFQKRFNGTYRDAENELDKLRNDAENAINSVSTSPVIDDYAQQYLDMRHSLGAIKETTYTRCVNRMNAFLYHLHGMPLHTITAADVERAYSALRSGDSPSGKKLSGTYLNSISQTAAGMFDKAVRDGYMATNPVRDAETPRIDTKPKNALTPEQARAFIAALDVTEATQMALLLCITMGLRRSEAISVKWSDIVDGCLIVKASKTASGVRTIPLTSAAKNALQKRYEWLTAGKTDAETEALKEIVKDWEICTTKDGHTVSGNGVIHWLVRNRNQLGVPGITVHELRHTYATLLAESGASPAVMQKLLGHASPVTSLKIYTHVHQDPLKDATAALDTLI